MTRYVRIALAAAVLASHPMGAARAALPENGRILMAKRTYVSTIKPDGSGRRNLARGRFDGGSWSPDKSKVLYREGAHCCEKDLWLMRSDGRGKRLLVQETLWGFDWAPSQRRVTYIKKIPSTLLEEECVGLYVMHLRSAESRLLTETPGCEEPRSLSWSPAGNSIMFTAQDDADTTQIFVVDLRGAVSQLTEGPGDNESPRWSPSGAQIAFESTRDDDGGGGGVCYWPTEIYVMAADGSDETHLSGDNSSYECGVEWLPNGKRLAWTKTSERFSSVVLAKLDGSLVRRLTAKKLIWLNDISPDGRWILYTKQYWNFETDEVKWFVFKVSIMGEGRRRILGPTVWSQPVEW